MAKTPIVNYDEHYLDIQTKVFVAEHCLRLFKERYAQDLAVDLNFAASNLQYGFTTHVVLTEDKPVIYLPFKFKQHPVKIILENFI